MTEVEIQNLSASQTLEIVSELRSLNYQQGLDFDFAYQQGRWDNMVGDIPKCTKFIFYNNAIATWFSLKYS